MTFLSMYIYLSQTTLTRGGVNFFILDIRILLEFLQIFLECEKVAWRNKIWCVVTAYFANQFQSERSLWHNWEGLVRSVLNQIRWISGELKTFPLCTGFFKPFSLQEGTSEGRVVPKGRVLNVLEVFQLPPLPPSVFVIAVFAPWYQCIQISSTFVTVG
jgi:hypothetical protein